MNYRFTMLVFDIETKIIKGKHTPTQVGTIGKNFIRLYDTANCVDDFFNDIVLFRVWKILRARKHKPAILLSPLDSQIEMTQWGKLKGEFGVPDRNKKGKPVINKFDKLKIKQLISEFIKNIKFRDDANELIIPEYKKILKNFVAEKSKKKPRTKNLRAGEKAGRVINCYAHNFSGFDSFFIIPYLISSGVKIVKLYVHNNNVIFLQCVIGNKILLFRDTALYISLPLSEIYKQFKWQKKFMETFTKRQLLSYLIFDLIGLYFLLALLKEWTIKLYRLDITSCVSLAQFSYANYRLNFMSQTLYYLPSKWRYRMQPFFGGTKIHIAKNRGINLYFYDVNSMYPYAMLKRLPNQYIGTFFKCNFKMFFGFIFVSVIFKPKNSFLCDLVTGIMFSEEIRMLLKLGFKFKFHYFIKFSKQNLFTAYVEHFYLLKKYKMNDFVGDFAKSNLNSLYGKLATKLNKDNCLHLSIAINSYARVEMMQYKQFFFFYSDTDSIVYNRRLSNKYISKDIGMMKLVAKIDEGLFIPNYYIYTSGKKTVIKAKGMIKKVYPRLTSLFFNFKLGYFKKQKYSIVWKETIFKFYYSIKNIQYYQNKKGQIGFDWLSRLF